MSYITQQLCNYTFLVGADVAFLACFCLFLHPPSYKVVLTKVNDLFISAICSLVNVLSIAIFTASSEYLLNVSFIKFMSTIANSLLYILKCEAKRKLIKLVVYASLIWPALTFIVNYLCLLCTVVGLSY